MQQIQVGPDDLAATRFAVSPVAELVHAVRQLERRPGAFGLGRLATHLDRAYARLRDRPGLAALRYLNGPRVGAAFACPPPEGMSQTIEADLARIRATDRGVVAAEIAEVGQERPPSPRLSGLLDDPALVDRLADAVGEAWRVLLEPEWPRLLAVLARDVRHRADQLTRAGWAGALAGMHERVRWHEGGRISVTEAPPEIAALHGRGLLLVPSVFVAPGLALYLEPPWQPAILYPARGRGLVWESDPPQPQALTRLLGRTRGRLLVLLAAPTSTSELAVLTRASLGATGDHLRVLLDAGLVTRSRSGRSVLYRRTGLANALVG